MDNDGVPNNRHGISYFPCQGLQELDDVGPPEVRVVLQQVIVPAQLLALWADADSANHRDSAMRVTDLIDRRHSWGRKGASDSRSHHEASLIYENKMISAFF
jgi:hypothetical protein